MAGRKSGENMNVIGDTANALRRSAQASNGATEVFVEASPP